MPGGTVGLGRPTTGPGDIKRKECSKPWAQIQPSPDSKAESEGLSDPSRIGEAFAFGKLGA
jgi:hypothetical protein